MTRPWPFFVAACALLFQPVPIVFIRVAARMAYGPWPRLPESSVWGISMLGLALCAGTSLLLGCAGTYALLTRYRPAVAIALILACCVPALIGGAVYLRAVLVFLTVV